MTSPYDMNDHCACGDKHPPVLFGVVHDLASHMQRALDGLDQQKAQQIATYLLNHGGYYLGGGLRIVDDYRQTS